MRRRWTPRRAGAVLLTALALLVPLACSGNDDDTADDESEESPDDAASAQAEGGASGGDTSRDAFVTAFADSVQLLVDDADDRRCMGEAVVDVVGLDTLQAVATPELVREKMGTLRQIGVQLDEPTAGTLYDAFQACVDLRRLLFPDQGDNPVLTTCLDTNMPHDLMRQYLIGTWLSEDGITPDPALQGQLSMAYRDCVASAGGQPPSTEGS